jgi:hypothetical protein
MQSGQGGRRACVGEGLSVGHCAAAAGAHPVPPPSCVPGQGSNQQGAPTCMRRVLCTGRIACSGTSGVSPGKRLRQCSALQVGRAQRRCLLAT